MPTIKRQVARLIERLSGNLVVPPHEVHLAPERLHLRRFLPHFGIDCVFDVGANRGQYATMLRQDLGYKGPIISYEPIPEMAKALRAASAHDPDWHVEELALDREPGPATFHVMVENQFSSLHAPAAGQTGIFSALNKVTHDIEVTRATLAGELPKWEAKLGFTRPFLKMDTQGNDLAVVQGAGEAVRRFVGLQSELAIKTLYDGSTGFAQTLAAYSQLGFELSALVPNNAGHFPSLVEIDCVMFNQARAPTLP